MSTIVIALIVAIPTLIATGVVPVILSRQTAEQRRADQQANWDREDLVAARAAEVARGIIERQDAAATLLTETNASTNSRLGSVAQDLKDSNAATEARLTEIHTLVNSNMTAEMERSLVATQAQLALLRRVIALNEERKEPSSVEDLALVETLKAAIIEMEHVLKDRRTAQTLLDADADDAAAAAADVPDPPDEEEVNT